MPASYNSNNQSTISLERCPNLVLVPNTPKGRGVFTSRPISVGTIIETSPVLVLDPKENSDHIEKTGLYHYTYNWPDSSAQTRKKSTQAVVFGLGSMFNHSTQKQNMGWTRDVENRLIVYRALRDITEGEELCISYGDHLTFEDADAPHANEANGEDGEEVLSRIQLDS